MTLLLDSVPQSGKDLGSCVVALFGLMLGFMPTIFAIGFSWTLLKNDGLRGNILTLIVVWIVCGVLQLLGIAILGHFGFFSP
jgi:hypothetical protein